MSEEELLSKKPFPIGCMALWDAFSLCLKPPRQFEYIRRHGVVEDCGELFSDWRKCVYCRTIVTDKANANVTREKIEEIYKSTKYYEESSKTNQIFHLKTKPSWDNE
mmetsp:Transcript_28496/g.39246  ORF Transcript_28496/g.39246 Transcript_28496/m.39246 type:complete len:107 (+) Transcript_28496:28-348(+)